MNSKESAADQSRPTRRLVKPSNSRAPGLALYLFTKGTRGFRPGPLRGLSLSTCRSARSASRLIARDASCVRATVVTVFMVPSPLSAGAMETRNCELSIGHAIGLNAGRLAVLIPCVIDILLNPIRIRLPCIRLRELQGLELSIRCGSPSGASPAAKMRSSCSSSAGRPRSSIFCAEAGSTGSKGEAELLGLQVLAIHGLGDLDAGEGRARAVTVHEIERITPLESVCVPGREEC